MRVRAVLFDLDGTLLDTLDDIADAANGVLVGQGFPAHPNADFRQFVGEGVGVLFRRALPPGRVDDASLLDRCVAAFREHYGRTWNVKTRCYRHIPELLDALVERGLALGVLSNKPDEFTRKCVAGFLGRWPFRAVVGAREGVPRKPDPTSALEVARMMELEPAAILYVGDTATDMQTARNAGMPPIGVSWGFRPARELREAGARHVIDDPLELLPLLEPNGAAAP